MHTAQRDVDELSAGAPSTSRARQRGPAERARVGVAWVARVGLLGEVGLGSGSGLGLGLELGLGVVRVR